MSIRVHELAKEFGIPSKALLTHLKTLKVPAKSHMSVLDDETAGILRHELADRFRRAGKTAPSPARETGIVKRGAPASDASRATHPGSVEPAAPRVEPRPEAPAPAPAAVTATVELEAPPAPPPRKRLELQLPITVKELAAKMDQKLGDVIKQLMQLGVLATINQSLDEQAVTRVAEAFGCELVRLASAEDVLRERFQVGPSAHLVPRAPVVTLMGHVDHGKTSLLDAIRQTNVTARESGGITQHIGAYEVVWSKGRVTFLDTPGHEAFTAMRARGATVTDIVVLVVAADDGVMPQTIEAIDHAQAAGVTIVVAINKMDKPEANAERVKRELMERGLVPEEWGGKTIMVGVSAKTKEGLDHLLEMLWLEAELLELKADPLLPARGVVLEGKLSKGSGPLAHVLVQNGTLHVGDLLIAGASYGRVRALINDRAQRVEAAGPGAPVEILGLQGVPDAGDVFQIMDDERVARQLVEQRTAQRRTAVTVRAPRISLEGLHQKIVAGAVKELKLVLKADVQGSLEALKATLDTLASEEVKLVPIHVGVGDINESDIMLAAASEAIVMGFHVGVDFKAQEQAIREGVDLHVYNVIYELTDEVRRALEGLLEPERKELLLGSVQIKQVFKVSKAGLVAGGIVTKGKVARAGTLARVKRGTELVHTSKLASLKRFKDDVREVTEGTECGLSLEGFTDYQPGDVIEVYQVEEVARKLT